MLSSPPSLPLPFPSRFDLWSAEVYYIKSLGTVLCYVGYQTESISPSVGSGRKLELRGEEEGVHRMSIYELVFDIGETRRGVEMLNVKDCERELDKRVPSHLNPFHSIITQKQRTQMQEQQ